MMIRTPLIADNLPKKKTLVAKQLPTRYIIGSAITILLDGTDMLKLKLYGVASVELCEL